MPEKGREPRDARRRAEARAAQAHAVQRQQDEAAQRRSEWERRRRRRFLAYALMALGAIVGGSHVLEHAGAFRLLPNPALQDIILGYPTAGVLVVVGLMMLPAQRY